LILDPGKFEIKYHFGFWNFDMEEKKPRRAGKGVFPLFVATSSSPKNVMSSHVIMTQPFTTKVWLTLRKIPLWWERERERGCGPLYSDM
jgi:hypothetical protein